MRAAVGREEIAALPRLPSSQELLTKIVEEIVEREGGGVSSIVKTEETGCRNPSNIRSVGTRSDRTVHDGMRCVGGGGRDGFKI